MPIRKFYGFAFELADEFEAPDVRAWFLASYRRLCHVEIRAALNKAGFVVGRIQKHKHHHLWHVQMQCGMATLEAEHRQANRQVRRILAAAGIDLAPDEILVQQNGDRILCDFVYDGGEEGSWR